MSEIPKEADHFGGGRVILIDPRTARAGFTPEDIHAGNRAWIERLENVIRKRRTALALVPSDAGKDGGT